MTTVTTQTVARLARVTLRVRRSCDRDFVNKCAINKPVDKSIGNDKCAIMKIIAHLLYIEIK